MQLIISIFENIHVNAFELFLKFLYNKCLSNDAQSAVVCMPLISFWANTQQIIQKVRLDRRGPDTHIHENSRRLSNKYKLRDEQTVSSFRHANKGKQQKIKQ